MTRGRSAVSATLYGLPLSSASSCASSSIFFSIRSARRWSSSPRCEADILRHGPFSNAARAAATALSTSAASASATWVIASPVEGLMVGNVLPETASIHLPFISSLLAEILMFGSITLVAVAMETSLWMQEAYTRVLREARTGAGHRLVVARGEIHIYLEANASLVFFISCSPD